jgi:hypothetical protein
VPVLPLGSANIPIENIPIHRTWLSKSSKPDGLDSPLDEFIGIHDGYTESVAHPYQIVTKIKNGGVPRVLMVGANGLEPLTLSV